MYHVMLLNWHTQGEFQSVPDEQVKFQAIGGLSATTPTDVLQS